MLVTLHSLVKSNPSNSTHKKAMSSFIIWFCSHLAYLGSPRKNTCKVPVVLEEDKELSLAIPLSHATRQCPGVLEGPSYLCHKGLEGNNATAHQKVVTENLQNLLGQANKHRLEDRLAKLHTDPISNPALIQYVNHKDWMKSIWTCSSINSFFGQPMKKKVKTSRKKTFKKSFIKFTPVSVNFLCGHSFLQKFLGPIYMYAERILRPFSKIIFLGKFDHLPISIVTINIDPN